MIDINNESGAVADEETLVAVGRHVLDAMGIHPLAELSVQLVDEDTMAHLHAKHMDEPGPTDVLSFEMDALRPPRDDEEPEPGLLGDVVLCPAVAARQARDADHSTDDELALLLTHGILHLLGYDHAEPTEEREMFGLQRSLLEGWARQRRAAGVGPGAAR